MVSYPDDTQVSLRATSSGSHSNWGEAAERSIRDNPQFIEFCANKRFTIRRRLGAGGMGVVYEAIDHERDEPVALKTILGVSPSAMYRFKREFRALADVTHPNLICLHDLFSEGEQMFFTMEFIDGVDVVDYIRTPPDGEPAEDARDNLLARLRHCVRQLTKAVGAVHAAGKLHRDIKPSNVLVTQQGRLVVLDFGLVSESVAETLRSTTAGNLVGTPAYVSPEQASGDPASEASDWYAVGVIAYIGLTGRLPFRGKGLTMLLAKQERDPPLPSEIVDDHVPEDLESVCMDLLSRDPDKRPRAKAILARLGEVEKSGFRHSNRNREPATDRWLFIGREQHLHQLEDAFEATHRGRAVLVHVYGRSGMGKTALVQQFLRQLGRGDGTVILTGRCYERESVSFKALDSLVDALCQHLVRLPDPKAAELMPRDILALARVFPVLQRVRAVADAPKRAAEIPDPRELRRRAFAALKELLARMADRRPLVLHIDDLQWGDRDSAALLADLLAPPDAPALLLIASYRSEYAQSAPVLQSLREHTRKDIDFRGLEVGPMPVAEACDLAMALIKHTDAGTRARARQIARESQGSPLFVSELARYAEAIEVDHHREKPGADILLEQVLETRLSHLTPEAHLLLELIAVAGSPLRERVLVAAASLPGDARQNLALLRGEHLIRTHTDDDGHTIESYHDRIREYMLSRLEGDQRRERHRKLAFAMETLGGADSDTLAVHFREAGEWERAGEYAQTAADQAAAALAFDRAARLYRLALEFKPHSDPGIIELKCKLANALANAGRGSRAARIYLEASELSQKAQALDLRRRAAEQLLRAGHYAEGLANMRTVVAEAGLSFPDSPRRAFTSLAYERTRLRLRGLTFRARVPDHIPAAERTRMNVCRSVVSGLSSLDPLTASVFHARHLATALRCGDAYEAACAMATEVAFVSVQGEKTRERTERVATAAQALVQQVSSSAYPRGLLALSRGIAAFHLGRWQECQNHIQRSEEILRTECVGASYEITIGRAFCLVAMTQTGQLRRLEKQADAYLRDAGERDNLWADTALRAGPQNLRWLVADNVEQATTELIRVGKRWPEGGFALQRWWTFLAKVHIDLYRGDSAEAWGRLAGRWSDVTQGFPSTSQWFRVTMVHLRACAALARIIAEGSARERAGLLRSVDVDLRQLQREKTLWARPLADLLLAGLQAVSGETELAIRHLQTAEQGFLAVDMSLHAAVARMRCGQLMPGERGDELQARGSAYLAEQGVRNINRMAALVAPGFPDL